MSRRFPAPLLAALPAALFVACSDGPAEPSDPFVVVAGRTYDPVPALFEGPPPLVRCAMRVRLSATGTGRSRFGEATIERVIGPNRTTRSGVLQIAPTRVQQEFAATVIVPLTDLEATYGAMRGTRFRKTSLS